MLLNFAFLSMGGAYAVFQFITNPSEISVLMMILLTGFVILPLLNILYIYKKSKAESVAYLISSMLPKLDITYVRYFLC